MCHKWDTCEMVEVTYRLKHSRHSRKKEILLWKKSENSLILKSKSGSRGSQYQTELWEEPGRNDNRCVRTEGACGGGTSSLKQGYRRIFYLSICPL